MFETISFYVFWLWALAFVFAGWAVYAAQRLAFRTARRASDPLGDTYTPQVAVIAPIKGVDEDTAGNIASLLQLDYPKYRVIFSIESERDPVLQLLQATAAQDPRVDIVIAGESDHRGQKVHNQLAAVERTTEADEVLVFVDADARPKPNWLRALVTPLNAHELIAATTGYRFYVPINGTAASKVVCAINAQVAALFGPYRRTFAWGGSMAMRRSEFFSLDVHQHWQNAMSDDYVLSYCVRGLHKRYVHFAPQCLVASEASFTWSSLREFAVRQYRITKVCAPWVWLTAVGGAALNLFVLAYTFTAAMVGFIWRDLVPDWYIFSALFYVLYGAAIIRGFFLMLAGETFLPEHKPAIRSAWLWFTFFMPIVMLVNFLTLAGAGLGRTITWRGITYKMVSRTKTVVSRPTPAQEKAPANAGAM